MKKLLFLSACILLNGAFNAQPLVGNYTLDPAQATANNNFASFTDLATALNTFGIVGAVEVSVKDGLYPERFELNDVVGTSAASTILIHADPTNIDEVELKGPGGSFSQGTVTLAATKYVTFDDIHFDSEPGTYSTLIRSSGQSADINFLNCHFHQPGGGNTGVYQSFIYASGTAFIGEGLVLRNCTGTGGSYVVYNTGNSTTGTRVVVEDCDFTNIGYAGVYVNYGTELIVRRNVIHMSATSSVQYGIRSYGTAGSPTGRVEIIGNDIQLNTSSTTYAVYMYYSNADAVSPSIIANNFFHSLNFQASGAKYLVTILASANVNIDHNTAVLKGGAVGSNTVFNFLDGSPTGYTPGGYNFRNNIVANLSQSNFNGGLMMVDANANTYFNTISNNIYWGENVATPFRFGSTSFTNYNAWSAASGDVNSLVGDPEFVGNMDLHVDGLLGDSQGIALGAVTDDIDGDTRPMPPATGVDIGADEFVLPSCPRPIQFEFISGTTSTAEFGWTSANAAEWQLEYGPRGFALGTGVSTIVTTSPATLSGIAPNSFYEVYLRSICGPGDTSLWAGPLVFHTYDQGDYLDFEPTCGSGFMDISDSVPPIFLANNGELGFGLQAAMLYQGRMVDRVTIGVNGGLILNSTSGQITNTIAGSSPNDEALFPFSQTLDVSTGGVYFKEIGVAPNRKIIFQWDSLSEFPVSTNSDPGTFQIVYEESTSEFYFYYPDVDFGSSNASFGGDAEIGVRGLNQDITVSMNNTSFLSDNSCIRWFYTDCPKPSNLVLAYLYSEEAAFTWTAGISNETDWRVLYGPSGFDPLVSGNELNTTSAQVVLPGLSERTDYDIYVYALCANGDTSAYLFESFTTPPHCSNPSGIVANGFVDSAIVNWLWTASNFNPAYDLLDFELTHGPVGFDPNQSGSMTNDDLIPGDTLYDNTFWSGGVYEVYVQANCANNFSSDLIGPIEFVIPITNNLPCGALSLAVDNQTVYFNNDGADFDPDEVLIVPPTTGGQTTTGWGVSTVEHTTWFEFVAPPSGQVRITGEEAGYTGQMAVYTSGDCSNISGFTLVGANDNDLLSSDRYSNFTLCGLTPGDSYYLMHDAEVLDDVGMYSLRLYEIFFEAGDAHPKLDVCYGDSVNLFERIFNHTPGGTWVDVYGTGEVIQDSIFLTQNVGFQEYFFEHRFDDGCAMDSVSIELEVFPPSYAGNDASYTVCKNEPFNLYQGLEGLVNHGGQWYDYQGNPMTEGEVLALTIQLPGTYNYTYIVGNGVCADDTVHILITSNMQCDYLGTESLETQNQIEVYPNPVSNNLQVDFKNLNGVEEVLLLNLEGKILFRSTSIELENTINMGHLAPGVYQLQVSGDSVNQNIKIVKP